jgi:hypothetical protein
MKIHPNREEAEKAIEQYANLMKQAYEATGAEFTADASDDSGMEYYVTAAYLTPEGKHATAKIHFQALDL